MTTKEILIAARAKIEKPENWCQGTYAMDKQGLNVYERSESACRWCSTGSLKAVTEAWFGAYVSLQFYMNGNIPQFNDTHTHAEVLEAFDAAIAACKE